MSIARRVKEKATKQRPAETGGIAGAIALLTGKLLGIDDPDTLVVLGMLVGFVPAAITWAVELWRAPRNRAGGRH